MNLPLSAVLTARMIAPVGGVQSEPWLAGELAACAMNGQASQDEPSAPPVKYRASTKSGPELLPFAVSESPIPPSMPSAPVQRTPFGPRMYSFSG